MIHIISLGGLLFGLWLLLSGHYEALLIAFGLVSCIVVVLIATRMDVVDHESFPVHLTGRSLTYVPWLLKEIAKANFDVARIILDPRLPISPRTARFRGTQRTDLGRVIYANSITLTPGTITTGVYGDEFEIHALTRAALDGTEQGEMDRRVSQLEGH